MKPFDHQAVFFRTLSHPTRLAVLEILRNGEQCVCHMEAALGLRQAALSQQLMILRQAGLVRVRRDGLNVFYRVARPHVFEVLDALPLAPGSRRLLRSRPRVRCPCPKCNASKPGARQPRAAP